MSFDDVKAHLIRLYRIHGDDPEMRLKEEDVQRWSASLAISRSELYDQIADYLARGFNSSELSFQFCDAIVNDIHSVITFADDVRPDLFWKVFNAFEEGEYYHGGNREQDPVEVYTRTTDRADRISHFLTTPKPAFSEPSDIRLSPG